MSEEYAVQPLTKGTLPPFLRRFQALNDAYNLRLVRHRFLTALVRHWCWKQGLLAVERWEEPAPHVIEYDEQGEALLIDIYTKRRCVLHHGAQVYVTQLVQPLYLLGTARGATA